MKRPDFLQQKSVGLTVQCVGETAKAFAADLNFLFDKAHGYRDGKAREEDLVRRFWDGMRDDEVRSRISQGTRE